MIFENYLFAGWEKTKTRQWGKNFNRIFIVGIVTLLTIALGQKLDKFLAVLGSVACTPIAFMFPALFHLKVCAETPKQKAIDFTMFLISLTIFVYCTFEGISTWDD
jgi:proton-coupled amino acid transporter